MKRIKTLETKNLCASAKKGGCGECQTSCQSACKPEVRKQEEQVIRKIYTKMPPSFSAVFFVKDLTCLENEYGTLL